MKEVSPKVLYMNASTWLDLMSNLNFDSHLDEFERIQQSYNQKHLHYHNAAHIADCLEKASLLEVTQNNPVLKLAIWYHDIVYWPTKSDNEKQSAIQAVNFLSKQDAANSIKTRVYDLILATIHKDPPKNDEQAYIMDIDISILGAEQKDYKTYCEKIRKEYIAVPWLLYCEKRIEILKAFLKREQLYYTDYYKDKFEQSARVNIEQEIIALNR